MTTSPYDPIRALQVLKRHDVRFIVIGGVAGRAWGSPSITHDLDVCYERRRENYPPLVRALRELEATLRGAPDVPFQLDTRSIELVFCP